MCRRTARRKAVSLGTTTSIVTSYLVGFVGLIRHVGFISFIDYIRSIDFVGYVRYIYFVRVRESVASVFNRCVVRIRYMGYTRYVTCPLRPSLRARLLHSLHRGSSVL